MNKKDGKLRSCWHHQTRSLKPSRLVLHELLFLSDHTIDFYKTKNSVNDSAPLYFPYLYSVLIHKPLQTSIVEVHLAFAWAVTLEKNTQSHAPKKPLDHNLGYSMLGYFLYLPKMILTFILSDQSNRGK